MTEIWSIIGLSSLIASVVTVVLGLVKEVLIEKYRFERQNKSGYIQSQIRLYSRIHFLLYCMVVTFGKKGKDMIGTFRENVLEVNKTIKENSDRIDGKTLKMWLGFLACYNKAYELVDSKEEEKEIVKKIDKCINDFADLRIKLLAAIRDRVNNELIPKYREIVGETVPLLE